MIRLYDTSGLPTYPLTDIKNLCIVHVFEGDDTLTFDISPKHALYPHIAEEIKLDYEDNVYVIKAINERSEIATVNADLDLDSFKSNFRKNYSKTGLLSEILADLLPVGWTPLQTGISSERKEVTAENATDLEILYQCQEVFGVVYQWAVKKKQLTIVNPNTIAASGQYLTDELNLESVNFKGDSGNLITRLYPFGKDGLSISTPGDTREYIDNTEYSNKVISAVWVDTKYEDAALLRAAAVEKLKQLARPARSYECSVIDLAKLNPDYAQLTFSLYDVVTLIDRNRKTRVDHQIVEYKEYPLEPRRNVITLSNKSKTIKGTIDSTITQVQDKIESSKNEYQKALEEATKLITGNSGGYVVLSPAEKPEEILILDQPSKEAARNVWRWNKGGLGHSANGYSTGAADYKLALTSDGAIVADRITTGVLNGGIIKAGSVTAEALSAAYKKEVTDKITGEGQRVEQLFKAADGELSSTISKTYTTKTETDNKLKSYSTTTQMNSAIQQKADSITTEVNKKVNNSEFGTKIRQSATDIQFAWNNISQIIQFASAQLQIYDNSLSTKKLLMALGANGMQFHRDNNYVGHIGTLQMDGNPSLKGLAFNLDQGGFMSWAYKANPSDIVLSRILTFEKNKGISVGTDFFSNGHVYLDNQKKSKLAMYDDGTSGILSDTGVRLQCGGSALVLRSGSIDCLGSPLVNTNAIVNEGGIRAMAFAYNGSKYYLEIATYQDGAWGTDLWRSDGRLKKNIQVSELNALEQLLAIEHRQFDWKSDENHEPIGYIAQEMEEINPGFVTRIDQKDEEGNVYDVNLQIDHTRVIPVITRSIQQLSEKIERQNLLIEFLAEKIGVTSKELEELETPRPQPYRVPVQQYGDIEYRKQQEPKPENFTVPHPQPPVKSTMTYEPDGYTVSFSDEPDKA